MSLIDWPYNQFSVKIAEFDNDHKKIVEYINELHNAMLERKGKEKLSLILQNLKSYTKSHFAAEEKRMRESNYPGYAEHKKLHEKLVAQVDELISDYELGKREVTIETSRFLKDWLYGHIQGTDKQYTPWLQKHIKSKG